MPTVPRLTRTVETTSTPGVRRTAALTPEAAGAGVELARGRLEATKEVGKAERAKGVARIGDEITQIGASLFAQAIAEEKRAANETAILEASNQLSDWKNKRLFDPENGAYTVKGKAAMPLPEEVRGDFDTVTSEIAGKLTTPEQKAAFAKLASQEWQGIDLGVRRHVFGEMQTYQAGELKHHVENAVNAAVQNASDPRLVRMELDKATTAIRASAGTMGLGPEAVDAQVRAVETQTHVGVISQLLATNQEQQAAAYYEQAKSQIAGERRDEVEKALEEGSYRGQSQKKADQIIREGGTLTEQRAKAREITDPKLRDQVEQRIEHNAVVSDREEREREETAMRAGFDIVDRTGDVTTIPPGQWASYSGSTRSALISYAKQRAAGADIPTNWGAYYTLKQMAADDPQAFAKANLLGSRHLLGDTEFKELSGIQVAIKSGAREAADKQLAGFRTHTQLVDDALALHGIDADAKPDSAEGKAIAQLRRMVDQRVESLQAITGKKATNEDIQAEIDGILSTSVTVPGSWWNILPGGQPFFESQKRIVDLTVNDIPGAARQQIEQALKARNRPVSDATVLNLFVEMQLRATREAQTARRR